MSALNDKFKVYSDPIFPAGSGKHVLTGHKGPTFLGTGYVYAPYIPVMAPPGFPNGFLFEPAPCPEPSIIDRIGALSAPECPVAKRVTAYDDREARREEAFRKWRDERAKKGLGEPLVNIPPSVGNQPPFLDPSDFALRRGIRTRFAKKLLSVNKSFFVSVSIENLK